MNESLKYRLYIHPTSSRLVRTTVLTACCICTFVLFSSQPAKSQTTDSVRTQIEMDLEGLTDSGLSGDPDNSSETVIHNLQELTTDPVNINRADVSTLAQIPSITFRLADNIVKYRSETRPFEQLSDLTQVKGIGSVTLNRIKPYVTLGSRSEQSYDLLLNRRFWTADSRFEFYSRFQQDLVERNGYTRPADQGGYVGGSLSYYQRARYRSDHLSLNITQSKDAGESFQSPAGFDYNSGHVQVHDVGIIKSVILGDYSIQFGQGLILWQSSSFGKNIYQFSSGLKNESGARPYTSSQETRFFRGGAITFGRTLQTTLFYSNRKLTASQATPDSIRYPSESGYHRTQTELNHRFNTTQSTAGGRLRAQLPFGYLGISGYSTLFSHPVKSGTQPWQKYDFKGRETAALSFDFRFVAGQSTLFGEIARSSNAIYSMIAGVEIETTPETKFSMLYRNYHQQFQSVFGSSFGENSGAPQNESGIYFAAEQQLNEQLILRGYLDTYRFPAPDYLMYSPSNGHEWAIQADVDLSARHGIYLQVRNEIEGDEYETVNVFGEEIRQKGNTKKLKMRLHSEWNISKKLRLRHRIEWLRYSPAGNKRGSGLLLYHDTRFRPSDTISIDTRFTWFQTDDYQSRLYAFENDLLYVFSSKALFDHGLRAYLLLNWAISDSLECWLKASLTHYFDRKTIGSGRSEISGNQLRHMAFQFRFRL